MWQKDLLCVKQLAFSREDLRQGSPDGMIMLFSFVLIPYVKNKNSLLFWNASQLNIQPASFIFISEHTKAVFGQTKIFLEL